MENKTNWGEDVRIERLEESEPAVVEMGFLVDAVSDRRYEYNSREIAIRLLNQVGVMVGRRIDDFEDWMRVVSDNHLGVEQILSAYAVSQPGVLELSPEMIEKMMEVANEHLAVAAARNEGGGEVILSLDTTVKIHSYRGAGCFQLREIFDFYTDGGQAWIMGLFSPLEAYVKMRRLRNYYHLSIETIRSLILWCRRAVGLPEDLVFRVGQEEGMIAGLLG